MAQESAEVAAEIAADQATAATALPPPTEWKAMEPISEMKTLATVFFSDFEGNNGGGVGTVDWQWGTYAWAGTAACSGANTPPAAPYSGTDMWGVILNDCYSNLGNNTGYDTCVNGNTGDDSILTFVVDLNNLSEAWLYFWEWNDLYLNWDWGEVYVNGTVVFQHCGTGYVQPTAWVQQEIDISAFAGGLATIEFHMMSSTVVAYAGWYIDDLLVSDVQIPVELQSFSVE